MLELNPLFSENAVLQRGKPVAVWGRAEVGMTVNVSVQSVSASCVAGADGRWRVTLPSLETSFNETLIVTGRGETVCAAGIAVGEVWLASGQSNMEFPMRALQEFRRLARMDLPAVRLYSAPRVSYAGQLDEDDFSEYRIWRTCTPDQLWFYPAVPYYFATRLYKAQRVPIGIVNCAVGGSTAAAWSNPERLMTTDARVWIDEYASAIQGLDLEAYAKRYKANPMFHAKDQDHSAFREKMWKGNSFVEGLLLKRRILALAANMPVLVVGPMDYNRPGALYENMIKAIAPFAVRGVLWYQGEADEWHPDVYSAAMECVVDSWCALWGEELPFLMVQVAPYEGFPPFEAKNWPVLREEQAALAARKDNVYLTNAMDAGMKNDIHPKEKRPVGERLALLARGAVYGEQILCKPPTVQYATLRGDALDIRFHDCGAGLKRRGPEINAWQVFADGALVRRFHLKMDGDSVTIKHRRFQSAGVVEVQYGWKNYCRCALVNSANIPVQPFKVCMKRSEPGGR